jgi:hypothetical protein
VKREDVARLLLEAARRVFPEEATANVSESDVIGVFDSFSEPESRVFYEFANLVEKEACAPFEAENKKLTEAISAFQKAWSEEDDQAVNDAFDALGDAKHPSVLRALGLPPEGGAP